MAKTWEERERAKQIGERLKQYREDARYTQRELEAAAQIADRYLSKIENGRQMLSELNARKIAKILKVDIDDLMCRRDKTDTQKLQEEQATERAYSDILPLLGQYEQIDNDKIPDGFPIDNSRYFYNFENGKAYRIPRHEYYKYLVQSVDYIRWLFDRLIQESTTLTDTEAEILRDAGSLPHDPFHDYISPEA